MNDFDRATFDRFASRFARIERLVPDPAHDSPRVASRTPRPISRTVGFAGAAVMLAAILGLAVIGSQTSPRPSQSPRPTAAAVIVTSAPTPGATRPTPGELQVANPELGGQGWTILEVDGRPLAETAYLSFWGGPTGGGADGDSRSDCWFIAFDYAYERSGAGIAFFTRGAGEGSGAEGCSDARLADYAAVNDALARVTAWGKPQADAIELIDARGTVVLRGGPLPPLPTPQASGDCGDAPVGDCQRAVALAYNFDLFPAPGQTVVSWSIHPSPYTSCATQGVDPKYEVVFKLANPSGESSATIGEIFGKLVACGAY
jgi:hypothetical protein